MKLNNKGFAITSIVYSILVLFLALVLLILNNIAVRQNIFEKQKQDILNKLEEQEVVYIPEYYFGSNASGTVGLTEAPLEEDRLTEPPTDIDVYLGYDVLNDKISAAYACFKRYSDGPQHCLKAYDPDAFRNNVKILNRAFPTGCSNSADMYICAYETRVDVYRAGRIQAIKGSYTVLVTDDGIFLQSPSPAS